jgi:prepilin-type processing-associated H-X9-DG protein
MRQLGLALHQHHDTSLTLPSGVSHPAALPGVARLYPLPDDPFPMMTWHTRLLPYIEQDELWRISVQAYQVDTHFLDDPPHLARTVLVRTFSCPADGRRARAGKSPDESPAPTSYLGVSGTSHYRSDGVFYLDSHTRFADITDRLSSTLMVGERPPSSDLRYGWWYGDWGNWGDVNSYLGVRETGLTDWIPGCPDGPYAFSPDRVQNPCSAFHFWSLHSGGANFLFADGSVRFLPYSSAKLLPALATRAGGEVAVLPD